MKSVIKDIDEFVTILGLKVKISQEWSLKLTNEVRFLSGDKTSNAVAVGFEFKPQS